MTVLDAPRPAIARVGGLPEGARWARRSIAVRGRIVLPPLPGAPMNPKRPGNRMAGRIEPHEANRAAIAAWDTAQHLTRLVVVFELDRAWCVWVQDGWRHQLEDHTPLPHTHDEARTVARRVWTDLRALAAEHPDLWETP